jgi:acyl-CoA synthetase (NDP forming)
MQHGRPELARLFSPHSVAVIGAAPAGQGIRGRALEVMRLHDFAGRIYPVSRSHAEVQGLKAYRSVAELPEAPDLAVLVIPAAHVPDELERCGKAGVPAAVVISSGFAEESGEAGRAGQNRLREIAARHGMALLGPNSEGFANLAAKLCVTFSPAVADNSIPLRPPSSNGRIAVVAQSGGMGFAFFDRGRPKGLAFSHIVTTGNEACLEVLDVVEHLVDTDAADAFILLLEDVKTAMTFRRAATKARSARKPIVAIKIGQSDAGVRAARSHTAALAGSHAAFAAVARRLGIIEASEIDEALDVVQALLAWRDRPLRGRRMAICTASGGGGGWLADACAAEGLEVPVLDPAARAAIDKHLPSYGSSENPIDGTAQAIRQIGYHGMATLAAKAASIDGVLVVMSGRATQHIEHESDDLARLARETEKPIVLWSYTLPTPRSREVLTGTGLPLVTNLRHAARAMRALADWSEWRPAGEPRAEIDDGARAAVTKLLPRAEETVPEHRARALLARYGIGGHPGALATSVEAAAVEARKVGVPVALKVQSSDVPHKTEAGAIALNLVGDKDVRTAAERILASVRRHVPDARIDGLLVQPMAAPGIEMLVGVSRDERLGPMVAVGLGGIHVEALKDVALLPAPFGAREARAAIATLRGAPLLAGVRGAGPADVNALAELLVRLGVFAADHADRIAEVDLNPVIVHPAGRGLTLADALIVTRPADVSGQE